MGSSHPCTAAPVSMGGCGRERQAAWLQLNAYPCKTQQQVQVKEHSYFA